MWIVDWFDPNNVKHLDAYFCLQETGFWPENFLPEDIEFSHPLFDGGVDWDYMIRSKIVKAFTKERLEEIEKWVNMLMST